MFINTLNYNAYFLVSYSITKHFFIFDKSRILKSYSQIKILFSKIKNTFFPFKKIIYIVIFF